jgi:hypothetical protein
MNKNLAYFVAAILALASVKPTHAVSQEEAFNQYLSSLSNNPGLAAFSMFTGAVVGIPLGSKAAEFSDQTAKMVNDKTGLSKNQTFLKKLAATVTHAGVNIAAVMAFFKIHGALLSQFNGYDGMHNYPILTAGLSFETLSFGLTLPIAAFVKSVRYALQEPDTAEDNA